MPDIRQTTEYRATQLVYSKSLSWVTQFDSITNLTGFLNIPRLRNVDNTHQKMNHQSKNATTLRCCCIHATLLGCPFVHPETNHMDQHGDLLRTTWSDGTSALETIFPLTSFTYSMHSPAAVVMLEDCGSWRVKIKKKNISLNWCTSFRIIKYQSNWRRTTRFCFAREIWLQLCSFEI